MKESQGWGWEREAHCTGTKEFSRSAKGPARCLTGQEAASPVRVSTQGLAGPRTVGTNLRRLRAKGPMAGQPGRLEAWMRPRAGGEERAAGA